jgi:hypothetical protein
VGSDQPAELAAGLQNSRHTVEHWLATAALALGFRLHLPRAETLTRSAAYFFVQLR